MLPKVITGDGTLNIPAALGWSTLFTLVGAAIFYGVERGEMRQTLEHHSETISRLSDKVDDLGANQFGVVRLQADMEYVKRELSGVRQAIERLRPERP